MIKEKEEENKKKNDIKDNLTKRLLYDDVTIKYYTLGLSCPR